ncbi:MAG: hypothetical protein C0444_09680 [Microbacterium sp.]|nr:hypothetical protein [Microbacterium sp.]MBA4345075.1 hypothetical protein [Microbacterium sp.]
MAPSVIMRRLSVSVSQDHLLNQVKSPRHGLLELVWNAFDADATQVDVVAEENSLGSITRVTVSDNGTGITAEQAERQFDQLGNSWKAQQKISDKGRQFHGQYGRGRWSAFGIGAQASWVSVAERITGVVEKLRIDGQRDDLAGFDYEEPESAPGQQRGTVVTIAGILDNAQRYFLSPEPLTDLTTQFATYVENYGITITFNGTKVDPKAMQTRSHDLVVEVPTATPSRVEVRVVEWELAVHRAIYFMDSNGAILHEMRAGIHAPSFDFTAYVRWAPARERQSELLLEESAPDPIPAIIRAVRSALRDYFAARDKEERSKVLERWKSEKSYPYKGDAANTVERAERELFEVVALTAAKAIEPMEQRERRLSFALIQQALSQNPQAVRVILRDVLDMPERKLNDLTSLLERTSLSSIVSMAKTVSNRLDFVRGLEHMVFDKQTKKVLLERSQLHKILAAETWILKEEYSLSVNDETLTTALRDHLSEFGRDDVTTADAQASEVLDTDGKRVVVDLILSSIVPQTANRREHVVIELKRPTVHINAAGLLQANKYAVAVRNDPRFEKVQVSWEFWIIGDTIAEDAKNLLDETGLFGSTGKGDNLPIRAVTWAQVIEDAKHRLKFVEKALEIEPSTSSGLTYFRENYSQYMPDIDSDDEADELDSAAEAPESTR